MEGCKRGMMEYVSAFIGLLVVIVIAVSVVIPTVMNAIGPSLMYVNATTCTGMRTLNDPDSHINDLAGVLSSSERTNVAAFIKEAYTDKCIDVGVIITNNTRGLDLFSYTTAAFDTAGLGGKNDSGLLMAIDTSNKKYFVETGYGLEGCMPDGKVGTSARANMLYPILDDFAGQTGGGGQGGTMKASGYGVPIVETLRTLTDGCDGTPASQGDSMAQSTRTLLSIIPLIIAVVVLLLVVAMIGAPYGLGD